MFDIGFSELLLVFVIGLIVLGPQRLPVAVKTVVGWIRAMRSLASSVQNELAQELKLQELQDSLRKVEEAGRGTLSPELKESMDELRKTADSMKRTYREATDLEQSDDKANSQATEQPHAPQGDAAHTTVAQESTATPQATRDTVAPAGHDSKVSAEHDTLAPEAYEPVTPADGAAAPEVTKADSRVKPVAEPVKTTVPPVSEEK